MDPELLRLLGLQVQRNAQAQQRDRLLPQSDVTDATPTALQDSSPSGLESLIGWAEENPGDAGMMAGELAVDLSPLGTAKAVAVDVPRSTIGMFTGRNGILDLGLSALGALPGGTALGKATIPWLLASGGKRLPLEEAKNVYRRAFTPFNEDVVRHTIEEVLDAGPQNTIIATDPRDFLRTSSTIYNPNQRSIQNLRGTNYDGDLAEIPFIGTQPSHPTVIEEYLRQQGLPLGYSDGARAARDIGPMNRGGNHEGRHRTIEAIDRGIQEWPVRVRMTEVPDRLINHPTMLSEGPIYEIVDNLSTVERMEFERMALGSLLEDLGGPLRTTDELRRLKDIQALGSAKMVDGLQYWQQDLGFSVPPSVFPARGSDDVLRELERIENIANQYITPDLPPHVTRQRLQANALLSGGAPSIFDILPTMSSGSQWEELLTPYSSGASFSSDIESLRRILGLGSGTGGGM